MSCQESHPLLECVNTTTRTKSGMWRHESKCGIVRLTPGHWPPSLRRICPTGECLPDPPPDEEILKTKKNGHNTATKAWSWFWAQVKWIKAGRPMRSQEEILRVHAVCAGTDPTSRCPEYDPSPSKENHGTCKQCGCNLSQIGGVLNKIAMATESCPLAKW